MHIVKTEEDGWDCEYPLKEVVDMIESCNHFIYEIKNCVRLHSLEDMVSGMKEHLQDAINTLDGIDTSKEYETVEYED